MKDTRSFTPLRLRSRKIRPILRQLKLQDFIIYYIFAYMFFFKKLSVWRNDIMNAFLLCSVWTPVGGWFYVDAGWHGRMSPDLTLSSGKEVSVIDHCWWQDRQQQWHWGKPSVELLLKNGFPKLMCINYFDLILTKQKKSRQPAMRAHYIIG